MKRKMQGFLISILMMLIMAGCATQEVWTYKAEPPVATPAIINKSVSVSPFSDEREHVNKNRAVIGLIPLMPFGWQHYKIPERAPWHMTSGSWRFNPTEDFAKAIAAELNYSGIFKEAFFTNWPGEGDLFLKGQIKSTDYNAKILSYCLSFPGGLLWYIGFPAITAENVLALSLQLVDSKTNEILWEGSYEKRDRNTSWVYVQKPDFLYDQLLKEVIKEALPSLKNKLANYQK